MKKIAILGLGLFVCALVHGAVRPQEAAMSEAAALLGTEVEEVSLTPEGAQVMGRTVASRSFYLFNATDGAGFAVIAADDNVRPVLGYSRQGSLCAAHLPDNVRFWLNCLTARRSSLSPQRSSLSEPIAPFLEEEGIRWNQNAPYNGLCPTISGSHCPTGCVATAFGQVMRYWKHPAQGMGEHSYTWNNQFLSAIFSQHTYDWTNMLGTYTATATTLQQDAVALLLSDIGIAVNMNYGTGNSSSSHSDAARALMSYFDYDPSIRLACAEYMSGEAFEDTVLHQLQQGLPVVFSGTTASGEGHAFICDGVDANGLFHINWGWGGYCDGYFALTALDPSGDGIGGAASGEGYDASVTAIINIHPNRHEGNITPVQMRIKTFTVTSPARAARTDVITASVNEMFNYGLVDWSGYIGTGVFTTDRRFVGWLYRSEGSLRFSAYYRGETGVTRAILSDTLPDGVYHLAPVYTMSAQEDAVPVTFSTLMGKNMEYTMTVTTDSVFFDAPVLSPYMSRLRSEDNGDETRTFRWEADEQATRYVVVVTSGMSVISRDTVNGLSATVRFYYEGKYDYSWQLYALDADNQVLDVCDGDAYTMTVTTDYTPTNVRMSWDAHSVTFAWDGTAPGYQVLILNGNNQYILADVTRGTSYTVPETLPSDGEYTFAVYATTPDMSRYISDAATLAFSGSQSALSRCRAPQEEVIKTIRNGRLLIRQGCRYYNGRGQNIQ